MIYKTVSSDVIIAKIFRDFKPSNSAWIVDALEWIGEGLEIMGSYTSLELKAIPVHIHEYKGKLPCALEQLEVIEYHGHRLPYTNASRILKNHNTNLPFHKVEYCTLNPNYINTSFEHGEVIVHCLVLPVDCNGLPMIPDNVKAKIALGWYCMAMMLLRGFKHQTITYKDAWEKWEKTYPQAQNSMNFPDLERYERFKKTWVNVVLDINKQSKFFDDYHNILNDRKETGTTTSIE